MSGWESGGGQGVRGGEPMSENRVEDQVRTEEEIRQDETAVPGETPDLVVGGVLRGKRAAAWLLRPVWKCLSIFFAPLWKPFHKGARGITKRDWILFFAMITAVALFVATPMILMKIQNTYREENELYTVILGQKTDWEKGKFEIGDGNATQFTDERGTETDVSGLPFYYKDRDAMFWPVYGLWYPVEEQNCKKVDCFSSIEYEFGKGCFIRGKDGGEIPLSGFLYDNENTYIVLENAKLLYNGEEKNLTPLSYVQIWDNGAMDFYFYGDDAGEFVTVEGEPEIRFGNGARIDLKGDMMYYPNGTFRLLFSVLDFYDSVTE